MSLELEYQNNAYTGATVYVVLDGRDGFNQGLRWNGTTFEAVNASHWSTYPVVLTETSATTGCFQANLPAGIAANSPLLATAYKQLGGSPAVSDTQIGAGNVGVVPSSVLQVLGGDAGQFLGTASLNGLSLATTATTSPVTLDTYFPIAPHANLPAYKGAATSNYLWSDGTNSYVTSTAPGITLPAAYFQLTGVTNPVGAYTAEGSATGAPVVTASLQGVSVTFANGGFGGPGGLAYTHLNAIYSTSPSFQIATDSSGRVLLQPTQTGVTIPTVTTLTNLPAAPANWLTSTAIASGAITAIQAGLSTYAGGDTAGTTTLLSRVPGVVPTATALATLSTAVGTPAQAAQIPAHFTNATFASDAVFATAALVNAPGGSGSDPLLATVPGSYASGTAGNVLGNLFGKLTALPTTTTYTATSLTQGSADPFPSANLAGWGIVVIAATTNVGTHATIATSSGGMLAFPLGWSAGTPTGATITYAYIRPYTTPPAGWLASANFAIGTVNAAATGILERLSLLILAVLPRSRAAPSPPPRAALQREPGHQDDRRRDHRHATDDPMTARHRPSTRPHKLKRTSGL